jgi:type I restriction enzyme S subunit
MSKYQAYPEYKDSGVEWLGEIPSNWEAVPLKFMCKNFVKDGPHETPEFIDSGIPFLSVDGIQDGKLVFEGCRFISLADHEYYSLKCKPAKGDVLLGKAASVGKVAYVDTDVEFNVWSPLAVITPKTPVFGRYIYYCLQSVELQAQCEVYSNANTQKNLGMNTIDNLDFPYPTSIEALKITKFLDHETAKIELLIKKQQQLVEFLKEKRQALISSAVTKGLELNVQMKNTNINWLGKLPEHWRVNKLRNLFTLGTGLSITRANLTDEGVPCVSYGEVHSIYGFELDPEKDSLQCVDEKYLQTAPRALLNKGDFIFADTSEDLKGSGNFTHLVSDGKVFAGYHTIIVRPLDNAVSRFYAYLFESDVFRSQIQLAVKGVKVYSITQAILKNATVWLPPKEEKLEIANYLDEQTAKIDTLIQKAESAITLMQERRTALISAAVTGKIDVRNWQAPVTSEVTE